MKTPDLVAVVLWAASAAIAGLAAAKAEFPQSVDKVAAAIALAAAGLVAFLTTF